MLDNGYFENQEEEVIICHCHICDGEIYDGDDIFDHNGTIIHEDCLKDYLEEIGIEKGVAR